GGRPRGAPRGRPDPVRRGPGPDPRPARHGRFQLPARQPRGDRPALALQERQDDIDARKSRHEMLSGMSVGTQWFQSEPELKAQEAHYLLTDFDDELKAKYERAAVRPWLPVGPDHPPPAWPKGISRIDERPQF